MGAGVLINADYCNCKGTVVGCPALQLTAHPEFAERPLIPSRTVCAESDGWARRAGRDGSGSAPMAVAPNFSVATRKQPLAQIWW